MTKDNTTIGPPSTSTRSSCFLGCFGCSGEKAQLTDEEVNSGSRRRRCWNSKWSFFKKSPTKTVPVDLKTSDMSWEIQVVEQNATSTKKHAMVVEGNQAPVTSDERKTSRKKWITAVKCRKGLKEETKLAATTSATGSGEQKTMTISRQSVSSPLESLTQSKSASPSAKRQKHLHALFAGDGVYRHRTLTSRRESDSIIGMSIILVILVILVLWGRLCAIVCTCAWFFNAPRLLAAGGHVANKLLPESCNNMDLESVEYKKKVILEGLLQRNRRNVVGRFGRGN